jgi:hypothetical protein
MTGNDILSSPPRPCGGCDFRRGDYPHECHRTSPVPTPLCQHAARPHKLQGAAKKTVDAYARAVRRNAAFSDRCPDDLTAEDLNQSKKLIGYYQGKTPGYGGGD